MTLREAVKAQILAGHQRTRVRRQYWTNPEDYLAVSFEDGYPHAWATLYSPACIPTLILWVAQVHSDQETDWEPYTGPTSYQEDAPPSDIGAQTARDAHELHAAIDAQLYDNVPPPPRASYNVTDFDDPSVEDDEDDW